MDSLCPTGCERMAKMNGEMKSCIGVVEVWRAAQPGPVGTYVQAAARWDLDALPFRGRERARRRGRIGAVTGGCGRLQSDIVGYGRVRSPSTFDLRMMIDDSKRGQRRTEGGNIPCFRRAFEFERREISRLFPPFPPFPPLTAFQGCFLFFGKDELNGNHQTTNWERIAGRRDGVSTRAPRDARDAGATRKCVAVVFL